MVRLLIIILISLFHFHYNEASKLFAITDDALSIGREILTEVEKTVPGKTNISAVAETMYRLIRKFHDKHNDPVRLNYINRMIKTELKSKTLEEVLHDFTANRAPTHYFKYTVKYADWHRVEAFFPDPFFINENVFNLLNSESMERTSHVLHDLLLKRDPDTGDSIFNILVNKPLNWVCWSSSRQQILYSILNFIITTDAFNLMFLQYNYAAYKVHRDEFDTLGDYQFPKLQKITSTWTQKNVIKKMKNLQNDFFERNTKTMKRFVEAMTGQSREAWSCGENKNEPKNLEDKEMFTKLENLFQTYIINEINLNEDNECKKECGYYNQTKQHGCYDGGICMRQRTCNGTLWDCGTEIGSPMNICLEDEDETKRYKFVQTANKTYGYDSHCDEYVSGKNWSQGFHQCTYCTCTCEDMNDYSDRYIDLTPVQSDIRSNYVITNAKFIKISNVIHIQIEESRLLTNGFIEESSSRWIQIPCYNVRGMYANVKKDDYHTITWNQRKVYLGDSDAPRNYVLTGLKFSSVNDGIKLEIGVTPFDFNTGKLSTSIQWTGPEILGHEWSEWKFENKDEVNTNSEGKYTKFTTNDLTVDAGQSTIPYVDTEEVIFSFRVPLSGAGLFTKSKQGEGSFLALKFLTYDFVGNM